MSTLDPPSMLSAILAKQPHPSNPMPSTPAEFKVNWRNVEWRHRLIERQTMLRTAINAHGVAGATRWAGQSLHGNPTKEVALITVVTGQHEPIKIRILLGGNRFRDHNPTIPGQNGSRQYVLLPSKDIRSRDVGQIFEMTVLHLRVASADSAPDAHLGLRHQMDACTVPRSQVCYGIRVSPCEVTKATAAAW